jgi:SAM-dependent methyltransferase
VTDDSGDWWNEAYESDPPWDVGRPQPAFVRLAEDGAIDGHVLDAGCGTGTHALYVAKRGRPVTGVDASERAVERARETAREASRSRPDLDVTFRVADLLDPPADLGPFETVLDSGTFHVFGPGERAAYADGLAAVVPSGGRAFVLAFGEDAPDDWGPNPVSPDDVAGAFGDGWRVRDAREEPFVANHGDDRVPGLLAVVERR